MKTLISATLAKDLGLFDPRVKLVVSACLYLGMRENQIRDVIRRGSDSPSWESTIQTAEGLGFDFSIDAVEVDNYDTP
jgi:hypothetical protein